MYWIRYNTAHLSFSFSFVVGVNFTLEGNSSLFPKHRALAPRVRYSTCIAANPVRFELFGRTTGLAIELLNGLVEDHAIT